MSSGTRVRVRRPAVAGAKASAAIRLSGAFTFAERPELAAPDARIIWHADLDPGALRVIAVPSEAHHPDRLDPEQLAPWLTLVTDRAGREHAVLSDGWHHIRLDLEAGSLVGGPVVLHYHLHGLRSAETRVMPLRRLLHFCRHRSFAASLFPADPRISRGLTLLRVHDALQAGASQREIASALFGDARVIHDWRGPSDSLRSRIRRLAAEARTMARGGYRALLRK